MPQSFLREGIYMEGEEQGAGREGQRGTAGGFGELCSKPHFSNRMSDVGVRVGPE